MLNIQFLIPNDQYCSAKRKNKSINTNFVYITCPFSLWSMQQQCSSVVLQCCSAVSSKKKRSSQQLITASTGLENVKERKLISYQMICAFILKLFRNTLHCCHDLKITQIPISCLQTNKNKRKHARYSISLFPDMSRTHQAGSHYRVDAGLQGSSANDTKTGLDGALAGYIIRRKPKRLNHIPSVLRTQICKNMRGFFFLRFLWQNVTQYHFPHEK